MEGCIEMKCGHCGTSNPDTAKFCRKCGKPFVADLPKSENIPQQSTPVPIVVHTDTVCPFCGSENCQPMMRNVTKVRNSGYSASSGCCGLCLLGPFGLLCGLCGTGSKVDIKNETIWICQKCGKQHLSQKDALEKAQIFAANGMMGILLIALLLSGWFHAGSIGWLLPLAWTLSPVVAWIGIAAELSEELGYPFKEALPSDFSITKYLIIAEVITVAVLLFGGPVLSNILEGL